VVGEFGAVGVAVALGTMEAVLLVGPQDAADGTLGLQA
jgi:hypothetical protein